MTSALDQDTFQITSSKIDEKITKEVDLLVDQTHPSLQSSIRTVASPQARAIAIIDRSCSIEIAAKAIVESRTSSRGNSPYSPDLVVVNEFLMDEFRVACLKYAGNCCQPSGKSDESPEAKIMRDLLGKLENESSIKMHRSGNTEIVVVEILDRCVHTAGSPSDNELTVEIDNLRWYG